MYDILTKPVKSICREIDTVCLKGSLRKIRLFTVTLVTKHLLPQADLQLNKPRKDKKEERRTKRDTILSHIFSTKNMSWDLIRKDKDIIDMRRRVDELFEERFAEGYSRYIQGDWA